MWKKSKRKIGEKVGHEERGRGGREGGSEIEGVKAQRRP